MRYRIQECSLNLAGEWQDNSVNCSGRRRQRAPISSSCAIVRRPIRVWTPTSTRSGKFSPTDRLHGSSGCRDDRRWTARAFPGVYLDREGPADSSDGDGRGRPWQDIEFHGHHTWSRRGRYTPCSFGDHTGLQVCGVPRGKHDVLARVSLGLQPASGAPDGRLSVSHQAP